MPIVKKEERWGITEDDAMLALYKIYTAILAKRLRREVEGKGIFYQIRQGSGEKWGRWTIYTR